MSAWEDFTAGYQAVTGSLNQKLGDFYDDYQTWAKKNKEMLPEAINKFGDYVGEIANTPGADYIVPGLPVGMLAKNYRTAEQLQALRRRMAEENRARGAMGVLSPQERAPITSAWELPITPEKKASIEPYIAKPFNASSLEQIPNPFDQILRGSWYHGLSTNARNKVIDTALHIPSNISDKELALYIASKQGFPISLHDSASISNKLGEPAGVSLSALPTVSGGNFTPDHMIHRVMPLYSGPPTQRTVNLMTPEGRAALNDAYDVVANPILSQPTRPSVPGGKFRASPLEHVANVVKARRGEVDINNILQGAGAFEVGPFNKALSDQLQSQGYRGILYNPQRWNEYEMLMLDPKYALPLDYRKAGEYMILGMPRLAGYKETSPSTNRIMEMTATPGVQKGLDQIRDVMEQNHSRLGDIYAERPWTQRLNQENKQRLLELIDPNYRDVVGNQLYNPKPYEVQSSGWAPNNLADFAQDTDWKSFLPKKGFTTDSEILPEQLIDIPKKHLVNAFQSFGQEVKFTPGGSKWDDLSGFLSDIEFDEKMPQFIQHLNKLFIQ